LLCYGDLNEVLKSEYDSGRSPSVDILDEIGLLLFWTAVVGLVLLYAEDVDLALFAVMGLLL